MLRTLHPRPYGLGHDGALGRNSSHAVLRLAAKLPDGRGLVVKALRSAVGILSMNDGDDLDHQDLVDDVVGHPVFTASGRVERKHRCFQLFAEPPRICGQRLMDEFKRLGISFHHCDDVTRLAYHFARVGE